MERMDRLLESYLDLERHLTPAGRAGDGADGGGAAHGAAGERHQLGRFDADSMRQHLAAFRAVASAVEELDVDDVQDEIDRTALLDRIRTTIARFEHERPQARDPGFWIEHVADGLTTLLLDADPAGPDPARAVVAVSGIIGDVPAFLDAARATLQRPPAILTDRALLLLGATGALLVHVAAVLGTHAPGGPEVMEAATGAALEALRKFGTALRGEIEPDANPHAAALGRERFELRLHHEHAIGTGAGGLWRGALAARAELDGALTAAAGEVAAGRDWREVVARLRSEHVADRVAALREAVDRARHFAAGRALVPVIDAPLEISATPAVLEPLLPEVFYRGSGDPAHLLVGAPLARAEVAAVAARAGVPGRHEHAAAQRAADSAVRRALDGVAARKGWSLYAEQMMGGAGFYATPEERLLALARQLDAVVSLAIDVSFHAREMAPADAAALATEWAGWPRARAERAVRRAAARPTELLAAEAGRRELVRLRTAAGVSEPDESSATPSELYRFHGAVLARGGLPPGLTGWSMGLGE
ncbi:MAG TPA: DUF885 family protein [Gemmatimonadales bacterium]|nr:DUF885 family protein [Gemmatimonadales bacterium]